MSSSCASELSNSISIVNLLTPPSSSSTSSSYLIENNLNDQSIIDEITSQFGEICPPLPKKSRNRLSKKLLSTYSSNVPLDLSLKKRPSSFDFFCSQTNGSKHNFSICFLFYLTVCVIFHSSSYLCTEKKGKDCSNFFYHKGGQMKMNEK